MVGESPGMPPSFAVVRIGVQSVWVPELDELFRFLVVIVRSNVSGAFQRFGTDAEFRSLEEAQAQAETFGPIAWRASTEPLAEEQPCCLCGCTMGRLLEARERHPDRLCQVCAVDATDEHGRRLRFGNIDAGGGFRSWYVDSGEQYGRHQCFVGGREYFADEARFGGIVITPRR